MVSAFQWTEDRTKAVICLAGGGTQAEAAAEAEVTDRTVRNWLTEPEFAAEVDRLSLMVGISSRAERLRIAMRVLKQKMVESDILTEKDALDWLKFAQSETDGVKLDLTKLTALSADATPLAHRGQSGATESNSSGSEPQDAPTIG